MNQVKKSNSLRAGERTVADNLANVPRTDRASADPDAALLLAGRPCPVAMATAETVPPRRSLKSESVGCMVALLNLV
jgi:hypothetical protein